MATSSGFSLRTARVQFIILVLVISWSWAGWIFSHPNHLSLFNLVMLLPGLLAVAVGLLNRQSFNMLIQPLRRMGPPSAYLFALFYPVLFVTLLAAIAVATGQASIDPARATGSFALRHLGAPSGLAFGLLLTLGEEYGWRAWLLEQTRNSLGYINATLLVGIVWAAWHAPFLYGLAQITGIEQPWLVMSVQMVAVVGVSFAFSYSYLTSLSVWPPVILHFVWNLVNPMVLGNIYSGTGGMLTGDIFWINGEGMAGAVLHILTAVVFLMLLKKMEVYSAEHN